MVNYIFKLEFNYKDTIFFSIQNKERDVALIVFEDCCRKGELLKDFPFLCPQYYSSDVGRILRTFKIKKNVEVTDNGKDNF